MSVFTFIAADLVAIGFMVFALYFPRHRRRDLIVAFMSINVGVMGVTYAMSTAELSLGFGLGIFAVLSIIRLRSTEMDHAEIAYYFTAIALGLLGGFPSISPYVSFTLMAVLLGVIAVGDSPALFPRTRQQIMVLDRAVTDEAATGDRRHARHSPRCSHRSRDSAQGGPDLREHGVRRQVHPARHWPGGRRLSGRPDRIHRARDPVVRHLSERPMTPWMDTVHALSTLTLDEVNQKAALQTRVDRKYIVRPDTWGHVLTSLDSAPSVLEIDGRRSFRYSSTYYDTSELDSYRDAARSRPHRYKVRTRHYLDTGSSAVEVKLRSSSGATAKSRQWLDVNSAPGGGILPADAATFVGGFERIGDKAHQLAAVLTTSYERVTLVTADARVTVDRHVAAADIHGRQLDYGDLLIVETKSPRGAGAVDRALWASGIRPARISKYCTSLAALRPELPSNRWSRSIRRYVPTAAAPAAAA